MHSIRIQKPCAAIDTMRSAGSASQSLQKNFEYGIRVMAGRAPSEIISDMARSHVYEQLDGPDATVPVLVDDQLQLVLAGLQPVRLVELGVVAGRLLPLDVVVLAIGEDDDVGVLLDLAGPAQVRHLRALVVPVLG